MTHFNFPGNQNQGKGVQGLQAHEEGAKIPEKFTRRTRTSVCLHGSGSNRNEVIIDNLNCIQIITISIQNFRSVVIMEICAVPIDWKMLTTLRENQVNVLSSIFH